MLVLQQIWPLGHPDLVLAAIAGHISLEDGHHVTSSCCSLVIQPGHSEELRLGIQRGRNAVIGAVTVGVPGNGASLIVSAFVDFGAAVNCHDVLQRYSLKQSWPWGLLMQ